MPRFGAMIRGTRLRACPDRSYADGSSTGVRIAHPARGWRIRSCTSCTSRDSPKLHPHVPERLRGTYAGLAEPAVIDDLTRLGVTAVELLPSVSSFTTVRWSPGGPRNYRGYQSIDFFAPHNEYSSDGQVDEFKAMVKSLHTAGLEMILDVVFNHTAQGNERGPTLCFHGLTTAATSFWPRPQPLRGRHGDRQHVRRGPRCWLGTRRESARPRRQASAASGPCVSWLRARPRFVRRRQSPPSEART